MVTPTISRWTIVSCIVLLTLQQALGQFEKGTHYFSASPPPPAFIVSGLQSHFSSALFQSKRTELYNGWAYRDISLSSTYGFFIRKNLLLKADFVFSAERAPYRDKSLFIKPAIRYYFPVADSTLHLFSELGVSNYYDPYHDSQLRGEASLGLNKMLAGSVGIDLALTFRHHLFWDNEEDTSRELLLHGGLAVYLGRKKDRFANIQPAVGKGTIAIGATRLGLIRYNDLDFPGTRLYFSPQVTYFLSDRLGIGLGLGLDHESYQQFTLESRDYYYESYSTDRRVMISPRLRYQLARLQFVILSMEAGAKFESRRRVGETLNFYPTSEVQKNRSAFLGPVFSVFLTNQLALEAGFMQQFDFGVNELSFNAQLGVQVFLLR